MTDNERVVKELRDLRRYFEDKEWSDNRADRRSAKVYWQTVTDALAVLKAQEAMRCKNCRSNHQCAIQSKFADADDEENWFCAYFNQIK